MIKAENGTYEGMLFDLAEPIDYVVEAAGVTLAVAQAQRRRAAATRRRSISNTPIPSYTGLEPRKIEDGGDIAVLGGTDVKLTITPTMATKGGRVVLGEKEACRCR